MHKVPYYKAEYEIHMQYIFWKNTDNIAIDIL